MFLNPAEFVPCASITQICVLRTGRKGRTGGKKTDGKKRSFVEQVCGWERYGEWSSFGTFTREVHERNRS